MTLKDKVAIVTGASRGIGEAIARKFCQEGASVMLCSRSAESVATIAESLSDESGNAKSATLSPSRQSIPFAAMMMPCEVFFIKAISSTSLLISIYGHIRAYTAQARICPGLATPLLS